MVFSLILNLLLSKCLTLKYFLFKLYYVIQVNDYVSPNHIITPWLYNLNIFISKDITGFWSESQDSADHSFINVGYSLTWFEIVDGVIVDKHQLDDVYGESQNEVKLKSNDGKYFILLTPNELLFAAIRPKDYREFYFKMSNGGWKVIPSFIDDDDDFNLFEQTRSLCNYKLTNTI